MRKVIDKEKLNQFVSTLPFKKGWLVEVKLPNIKLRKLKKLSVHGWIKCNNGM